MRTPKVYEDCTLETFDASENPGALEAARAFIDGRISTLLLLGRTGIGKTHLLVGVGKAMTREGGIETVEVPGGRPQARRVAAIEPVFYPILRLVGDLRDAAGGRLDYSPRRLCFDADVLLLDEWGAERVTDFILPELEAIVEERWGERKPLALTSNLTLDSIIERYGDRLVSRFTDRGCIVQMTGRDRRPEMGR